MEPSATCCLGLNTKGCPCARGKGLGGSSLINVMLYVRGNRKDYDGWAAAGNPGWDYDSVLPHFRSFERALDGNPYYGQDGELILSRFESDQKIRSHLIKGFQELGYGPYSETKPSGYTDLYMTISEGTRWHAGKAFLSPIKDRKNLYLALNAQVPKIYVDPKTKRAQGVKVRVGDKYLKIGAKKEVILSAGAINSPQILLNSGVGPAEHLRPLGIEVLANLAVGENYQDHFVFTGFVLKLDPSALEPRKPTDFVDEIYQYFVHRKGPLVHLDSTSFAPMFNVRNDSDYPTTQVVMLAANPKEEGRLSLMLDVWQRPQDLKLFELEVSNEAPLLYLMPVHLKPKSRGKVRLRSKNPFDAPKIIPNFLEDERDLEAMLENIRFLERLVETKALSEAALEILHLDIENCKGLRFRSDDYWRCALRNIGVHLYHPVGTCKMGPESDSGAVVDARLRVHGVKGLRVVDASIMPEITSGNTNGPCIMIGERGAALIKEDWRKIDDEL